jgi:hypothetical protein
MKTPVPTYSALAASLSACLVLQACHGGIVSSSHVTTTSTINEPFPANAYYFLPLVKVRLIAERKSGTPGCTLKLKETLTEPDPRYMFSLSHLSDIFSDDQVTITLATNGLLTKVETTSEGKIGEVLVKLAELTTEIMKASAGLPTGGAALRPTEAPLQYEMVLDPTDKDAVSAFNTDLNNRGCNLQIDVRPPEFPSVIGSAKNESQQSRQAGATSNPNNPPAAVRNGIFYRPALPYIISFKTKDESRAPEIVRTAQTVYLPNAAPVLTFDIKRPAFVKFTQTVEFENGMLKNSSVTKPSEAIGFVSIPVDIAKSIVAIPSELFKFRVETTKGEAGVLDAQKSLLEAQTQLLEEQDKLRKAKEEAQKPPAGQTPPIGQSAR